MSVSVGMFFKVAATPETLVRGAKVASIVGCVLNGINQGELFFAMRWDEIAWLKVGLTFCVPFCVSVYSATAARFRFDPGTKAMLSAHLQCTNCGKNEMNITEGEVICECPCCKAQSHWEALEPLG